MSNEQLTPVNVPYRPLTAGMVRNLPSNGMPEGSFLRLRNVRAKEYGLRRRGGFRPFNTNSGESVNQQLTDRPLHMVYHWSDYVNPEMVLIGSKNFYRVIGNTRFEQKTIGNALPNGTDHIDLTLATATLNSGVYDVTVTIGSSSVTEFLSWETTQWAVNNITTVDLPGGVVSSEPSYNVDTLSFSITPYDSTVFTAGDSIRVYKGSIATATITDTAYSADTQLATISLMVSDEPVLSTTYDIYKYTTSDGTDSTPERIGSVVDSLQTGTYTYNLDVLFDSPPSGNIVEAGNLLIVVPRFVNESKMFTNYAVVPGIDSSTSGYMVLADQAGNGLFKYTNESLNYWEIDSSVAGDGGTQFVDSAGMVVYFQDRVWLGNTWEQGTNHTQRIRWSDPVNFSRFRPANYIDLPYSSGKLLNLVPMGSLLIAYYEDAIYIGRPTNIANLPYLFERLETGNNGLLNQQAIIPWSDGHFFCSQDGIYRLTASGGLEELSDPILSETLEVTKYLGLTDYIQIQHDPENECITVLFPDLEFFVGNDEGYSTRLWRFNYKTSAWTYDEVAYSDSVDLSPIYYFGGLVATRFFHEGRSWEDWQGTDTFDTTGSDARWIDETGNIEDFYSYMTWENLKNSGVKDKKIYLGVYNVIDQRYYLVEEYANSESDWFGEIDASDEEVTYPIKIEIESPDFEFGLADTSKTVTRLGMKLFENRLGSMQDLVDTEGLSFDLYLSDSMGYDWKRPKTLVFKRSPRGVYNEAFADFRCTGSTFRFRLVGEQEILPYKIGEFTMRVIGKGLQINN